MSDDTYKVAEKLGEKCNFSIAVFEDRSQPKDSRLADAVAKQFIKEFAQFCFDRKLTLESGIGEIPVIGHASYLSVNSPEGRRLFLLAVPHDIIEVTEEKMNEPSHDRP